MSLPEILVTGGAAWLILGGAVAAVFLLYGVDKILEDARGVYLFRVLAAPGAALIWPIVIWRWHVLAKGQVDWRQNHSPRRRMAGILELAMALALIGLLAIAALSVGDPSELPAPVKIGENVAMGTMRL